MSWDAIDNEEAELDPSSGLLTLDPSSTLPTSDPRLEDEERGATPALLSLVVRSPVCVCVGWVEWVGVECVGGYVLIQLVTHNVHVPATKVYLRRPRKLCGHLWSFIYALCGWDFSIHDSILT